MSTNLYDFDGLYVTRFACGECREDGPCYQITSSRARSGDYVIVHRKSAEGITKAIQIDLKGEAREVL